MARASRRGRSPGSSLPKHLWRLNPFDESMYDLNRDAAPSAAPNQLLEIGVQVVQRRDVIRRQDLLDVVGGR